MSKTVEEIFHQAIGHTSVERRELFLKQALAKHPELRGDVEELIRSHEEAGSFLAKPIVDLAATSGDEGTKDWVPSKPSTQIGPYRLIQPLGQGGMGTVYLAEQSYPVRRRVALKLIKPGMDSAQVLKRFEAERQALAIMDHSSIAKVFDAGTTPAGHPYFVMELIKGVPITEYCNELNLTLRARLELLIPVCHAIHHAHQKGIIHRDIKPSNVLVAIQDGKPVPKVIDFGVAKATHQPFSQQTFYTEIGAIIGTLDYMSPEQAVLNALDIDTRVDVYSLGVVLYELLTDTTPLDRKKMKSSDVLSILTRIREHVPPRPSSRLSGTNANAQSLANRMKTNPAKLSKALSGDLDWIVMKCLEKDRCRRYDSAMQLAEELDRYLRHQPVLARRPSIAYRISKFCERRRVLLRVATVLAAMLAIIAVIGWKYRDSAAEAKRERIATELAETRNLALEKLDEIQALIDQENYQSAFDSLLQVESVIKGHPRLAKLREGCSQIWTFTSNEPATQLWRRDYFSGDQPWIPSGSTTNGPEHIQLPRSVYLWKATKEGFRDVIGLRLPQAAHFDLDELDQLPDEMVRIPAGPVSRPSMAFVFQYGKFRLPSYFIDRYEVSNADYAKFMSAGGYDNPLYWKDLEFIDEVRNAMTWNQAKLLFVDRSGMAGPATWENGRCNKGTETEPVMGVSWYEAMAFAKFANKELPTVYHWENASQHELAGKITTGQIFDRFHFGDMPLPPSQLLDHGIYGTTGTGGNANEWTRNATESNDRFILGGGCGETLYKVVTLDHSRPIRREKNFGFRCMKSLESESPELSQSFASVPWATPPHPDALLDQKTFDLVVADRFTYDHSKPLGVQLEQRDEEKWIHITASFNAAYQDAEGNLDRVIAHLYLPKTKAPKDGFQSVVYMPPLDAAFLAKIRPLEKEYGLDRIVASGRAVLRPIYAGSFARKPDAENDRDKTQIKVVQDLMRANDFLVDREDIDESKIAYYGFSLGAEHGYPALAVDPRFQAAIFQGAGFHISPVSVRNVFREPVQTWPRIQVPVLMIGGDADQLRPIKESQQPMLALLGSKDKQLIVCPGGHMLPADKVMEKLIPWLDERFGNPATK